MARSPSWTEALALTSYLCVATACSDDPTDQGDPLGETSGAETRSSETGGSEADASGTEGVQTDGSATEGSDSSGETTGDTDGPGPDESDAYYDPEIIIDVRITIAPEQRAILDANPFARVYVPGGVEALGQSFDNVGLRYKGNSSLASADGKPSWKVSIDEYGPNQTLAGLKTLNFNNMVKDPSMQREMIAYEMLRDFGLAAPRANYARLYVNDEYAGLFLNVEQVNKTFLNRWFADNDGNLYKQYSTASLEYRGADPAAYDDGTYRKKTNEDIDDWSDLVALCELLDQNPDAVEAQLGLQLDVSVFLRFLAVNTYLSHIDAYTGFANNYYLYADPDTDRFVYIPWDLDISFGTAGHGGTTTPFLLDWDLYNPQVPEPLGTRPLLTKVMASPAWRGEYTDALAELLDDGELTPRLSARLEEVRALISEAALDDSAKPYSNDEFSRSLDQYVPQEDGPEIIGLVDFVEQRTPIVAAALD